MYGFHYALQQCTPNIFININHTFYIVTKYKTLCKYIVQFKRLTNVTMSKRLNENIYFKNVYCYFSKTCWKVYKIISQSDRDVFIQLVF